MPVLQQDQELTHNDFFIVNSDTTEGTVTTIVELVKTYLPEKFGMSSFTDVQVLSPMTKGIIGTKNLNLELQKILIPDNSPDNEVRAFGNYFKLKDKVMQTSNNYDKNIYNGDIGVISKINKDNQELIVNFEGRGVIYKFDELEELMLAYAITIHKSQGSEYNSVIIPLMMQHYPMLQRNLIYTAITRAKKLVIIVGQKKALTIAINKKAFGTRYSTLKKRLIELTQWY